MAVVQLVLTVEKREVAASTTADGVDRFIPRVDPVVAISRKHEISPGPRSEEVCARPPKKPVIAAAAAHNCARRGRTSHVIVTWPAIEHRALVLPTDRTGEYEVATLSSIHDDASRRPQPPHAHRGIIAQVSQPNDRSEPTYTGWEGTAHPDDVDEEAIRPSALQRIILDRKRARPIRLEAQEVDLVRSCLVQERRAPT